MRMDSRYETITPREDGNNPPGSLRLTSDDTQPFQHNMLRAPAIPSSQQQRLVLQSERHTKSSERHTNSESDITKAFLVEALLMTEYHTFSRVEDENGGGGALS